MKPSRLTRLGDATSQWLNVLIFNGDPNYSISGDAYRLRRDGLRAIIDVLFWFDPDHCRQSYLNDLRKACKLCDSRKFTADHHKE